MADNEQSGIGEKDFSQVVLKNKKTGYYYVYEGNKTYRNLNTDQMGILEDEAARAAFVIPVSVNVLIQKNPVVFELIKKLGLKPDDEK